jgi:hypothetical protein
MLRGLGVVNFQPIKKPAGAGFFTQLTWLT